MKTKYIFSKVILNFSINLLKVNSLPSSCSYSRIGKLSNSWAYQNTYEVTEEILKDNVYMGDSFPITQRRWKLLKSGHAIYIFVSISVNF